MANSIVTLQQLINAQNDAVALEKIINEDAWVEINTRLGRKTFSIATVQALIDKLSKDVGMSISKFEDAIQLAAGNGASEKGWLSTIVATKITDAATQDLVNQKATTNVAAIADLKSLATWDNRTVYVKSIGQNYVYHTNNQEAENGVTVVSNWVMEVPENYYASWFALPSSQTTTVSQSENLRTGYLYATSKNRPFVIDDEFLVSSDFNSNNSNQDKCAIPIQSNSHLNFTKTGKLSLIANNSPGYIVLLITNGVSSVEINNPVIVGDRLNHDYSSGGTHEWGFGICIQESDGVTVNNPKISNMTGDGLYIGKSWGNPTANLPTNLVVNYPIIDRCRRNGLGFTSGKNCKVVSPYITNSGDSDGINGTYPKASIDIEPESGAGNPYATMIGCSISDPYLDGSFRGFSFYNAEQKSEIDIRITGTMTIANATNVNVEISSRAEAHGILKIDNIVFKTVNYRAITQSIRDDQNFSCEIGEISNISSSKAEIHHFNYGDTTYSSIGNFSINRLKSLNNASNFVLTILEDLSKLTTNLVISDTTQAYIVQYVQDNSYFPTLGNRYYVDGSYNYLIGGVLRSNYSLFNKVYYDTSPNNGGTSIANQVWIINDFSKKTIYIHPNSQILGTLDITGLKVPADGITYSKLTSKIRGAKCTVQVTSSNTIIDDMTNYTLS